MTHARRYSYAVEDCGRADDYILAACRLAGRERLNWMIYNTAMNSLEEIEDPTFDPWLKVTPATPGAVKLIMRTIKFVSRSGMPSIPPFLIFLNFEKTIVD